MIRRRSLLDGLYGNPLSVLFELLTRSTGCRYSEPHNQVANKEHAEQVAHQRHEPPENRNPSQQQQQNDRQKHQQAYPSGTGSEIFSDTRADAAQTCLVHIPVQPTRNTALALRSFAALLIPNGFGRSHLGDDFLDQREFDHFGVILVRKDQLGDTCFDILDDLLSAVGISIRIVQTLQVTRKYLEGIGLHREGDPRNTAFLNLFHRNRSI